MKYFKNTSWLFGEKILRMIVGLFVGVWVARYLGPEKFGLFSYAQSFVGLFTAFATLGLDGIVVRELVKDETRCDELIGTAFWLKLMGAFGVLFILAFAVNFTSNDSYTNTLVFIIASATIFQSFNVVDMYFQSKVMGKYVVFTNIISLLLSSILKVVLILYNAPLIAFAWVILFDSFVLACGFIYFYYKNHLLFKLKNLKFNRLTAIDLLRDSWPLMAGGMSFIVFSNIDNIMLHELLNNVAVGVYSAAYRLVTLWYFLPGLILSSFMPSLILSSQNKKLFFDRIRYVSSFLIWFAAILAILYNLFGEDLIKLTYGVQYKETIGVMNILIFVNILIFFNSIWNYWMIIENKTKRTLVFHFITAFLNIILNLVLIPIYGTTGAAYALLISLTLTFALYFIYSKEIFYLFLSSIFFGQWRVLNVEK